MHALEQICNTDAVYSVNSQVNLRKFKKVIKLKMKKVGENFDSGVREDDMKQTFKFILNSNTIDCKEDE